MTTELVDPPDHADLVADLKKLRERGIVNIRQLRLAALERAVYAAGHRDFNRPVEAPAIENLLRLAIDELDDGRWGYAATLMYGLAPGTRGDRPSDLRREAAEAFGIAFKTWRTNWEKRVIGQIAEILLGICHRHQLRLGFLDLERRVPTASRLAVAWLERFEHYFRIWNAISGLGNDLTAYRSTLLEEDRPYDREPSADDPGYSQEEQAAGYATDALFHYVGYLARVEAFVTRYGGLWLLSDRQAETDVASAVERIRLVSPTNEEDDSYLRIVYGEIKGELHLFRSRITTDVVLADIHDEWQGFVSTCECSWFTPDVGRGYFPTYRTHDGIDPVCQVHGMITGANDYCMLIEDDWARIADWYRVTGQRASAPTSEEYYVELRRRTLDKGIAQWPPWS